MQKPHNNLRLQSDATHHAKITARHNRALYNYSQTKHSTVQLQPDATDHYTITVRHKTAPLVQIKP